MRSAREKLIDNDIHDDIMLIDDKAFGESLVAVTDESIPRAVYDYEKMVEECAEYYNMPMDEAADHVCYNVLRSLPYYGSAAPIVIDMLHV